MFISFSVKMVTLYTGWTNDLQKRISAHSEGRGAKYTKARLPVCLVYSETFETKQEAMQREYAVKQLSRQQKMALINNQGNCKDVTVSDGNTQTDK